MVLMQVGSIDVGGWYDNLIGMFGSRSVPAVGVSLGIERVFATMEQTKGSATNSHQHMYVFTGIFL